MWELFQSTRPSRGATLDVGLSLCLRGISIHAPLAGRDALDRPADRQIISISIHAPLAGRDLTTGGQTQLTNISIHAPLAGRDPLFLTILGHVLISIHAPLAGRDSGDLLSYTTGNYFNPRAPRGARPLKIKHTIIKIRFQSTRPSRGAT